MVPLKYIAFCPSYIIPCHPFRVAQKNRGVKSCINDQFTEAGIRSKQRTHVLDTFFSSNVLENLLWERRLIEGDLRHVESKQEVHRTLFFLKLICQKPLYLNNSVTAIWHFSHTWGQGLPLFAQCFAKQDS
ncbi:hypothetical protein mRhiFer1_010049 [Rhinolophus ferrumequinum]|uniref:Uncharacterized protein n=1 Tax=Rhinolophus ferrumequinum TaxID=59479 RepID=A0A7J7Y5P0_RHIFE|nr:hypothetical protein mRhiFer1_010049 [Rhinolophus ferrumequinum]